MDGDGNRIFDDLEARLAGLPADGEVGVIVRLGSPATAARVRSVAQRVAGLAVGRTLPIVDSFVAAATKGQVTALAHLPEVVSVEENSPVRALNDGARASFGVAKARADVPSLDGDADGNPAAYSGGDLVAAVIDTGIHPDHLDLDEGKILGFKDFVNGRAAAYDDHGHGTHVAATIAGDGDARADRLYEGVAPAAGLVGVKVLDASGSGTAANVIAAIDWVVQNKDVYGIEAINLSLGGAGCSDGTDAESRAVDAADAAGIVVAVAAGNEGPGTCTIGVPAAAVGALTVGAMADLAAGGFGQASFSSRGPTADGRVKPDVSAPGVGVTSAQTGTTSGYVAYSGTSMATPFVAGVALLMLDADRTLTPAAVKQKLVSTAIDWGRGGDGRTAGSTGADIDHGAGRLDAYAALAAVGAPLTSPPAAPRHELREGTLARTGAYVDYKLDVGSTEFPIAATLIHADMTAGSASAPDFELFLYDPAGTRVASSERAERQEDIRFKPTVTGPYTLRVYSYNGGGNYFVDLSAALVADTTPPTIASTTPAADATGVAAGSNVGVAFSEAMDAAATQAAFSLVRVSDGAAVAGTFAWNASTMTFDPASDLAAGVQYRATVGTAAKDSAGNPLAAQTSWTFTTASAPASVTATPYATSLYSGTLRSGDATRLAADDDSYYQINSTTSGTRVSDWYGRIKAVPNGLLSLKVTYKGKASASCTQYVYVYNWRTSSWTTLDSRTVGTTEALVAPTVGGTLADYVSGSTGDGEVAIRVRCTKSSSFFTSGDLLSIVYTR